ncbi:MAG: TylF/MycF/NovP-related O-methyltransferase [Dehalococcoidia bacterium]
MASFILKLSPTVEGDIVECGAYNGGGTCKLSFIAKITNRKLIVCDSFEGLPDVLENEWNYFKKGDYSAAQSVFNSNVSKFGCPDHLEILPGWFDQTLPTLKGRKFVAIFEDADIYESVKCCLDNLWDGLQPGCRMYTHEMHRPLALVVYGERGLIVKRDGKRSGRLGYVTKL